MSEIVYAGYTQEELDAAFKQIQNKDHWKNPIDATIRYEDFEISDMAARYFAGSPLDMIGKPKNGFIRVKADGYYVAIGA